MQCLSALHQAQAARHKKTTAQVVFLCLSSKAESSVGGYQTKLLE